MLENANKSRSRANSNANVEENVMYSSLAKELDEFPLKLHLNHKNRSRELRNSITKGFLHEKLEKIVDSSDISCRLTDVICMETAAKIFSKNRKLLFAELKCKF